MCIEHLQKYVAGFQERRSRVTDAVVDEFMATRPLEWKGNARLARADVVVPVAKAADGAAGGDKMSKNQLKKLLKEQEILRKKADKEKAKARAAAGGEAAAAAGEAS